MLLQVSTCIMIILYIILFFLLELWLEWLRDEIPLATDESERKHVYDLFERAVKDYLCKFYNIAPQEISHSILACRMHIHCERFI